MLFNSLSFLLFFIIVIPTYFILPQRLRWIQLLVASCVFYMAYIPAYILVLFGIIIVDYFAGLGIEAASDPRKRKTWLVASLSANVSLLAFFKYYGFFNHNLDTLLGFVGHTTPFPILKLILPIGLSFHTFQAMSYTIEVYRGRYKAEHHLGYYALYVLYFPQLVAGPIERPQRLLPQFRPDKTLEFDRIRRGLVLMLWGLFKKVVVADRLSVIVDAVYADPTHYHGVMVVIAAALFSFQIYCDFSGYSDIARGVSRVLGIELMLNFNRPFFAKDLSEYWRRWHISLYSWFSDYVFMPLLVKFRAYGNRTIIIALLFTFSLSGFWHGAAWHFILFGLLNGSALCIEHLTTNFRANLSRKLPRQVYRVAYGILLFIFVMLSNVFFRANSVGQALTLLRNMAAFSFVPMNPRLAPDFTLSLIWMAVIFIAESFGTNADVLPKPLYAANKYVRWVAYYSLIFAIVIFGQFGQNKPFIYFQF